MIVSTLIMPTTNGTANEREWTRMGEGQAAAKPPIGVH
jgi:hypothetical protein